MHPTATRIDVYYDVVHGLNAATRTFWETLGTVTQGSGYTRKVTSLEDVMAGRFNFVPDELDHESTDEPDEEFAALHSATIRLERAAAGVLDKVAELAAIGGFEHVTPADLRQACGIVHELLGQMYRPAFIEAFRKDSKTVLAQMAELASGMEQSQPEIDQLIADATNDALGHHHGGAGATPPPNGQPGPNGRANNLANAYGGPLQPAVLLADRPHKAGGGCGNCGGHDCDCEHSPDRVGKPTWTFKGQAILFGRTIAAAPLGFVTGLLTILNVVTSIPAILGWLVGPVVLGSITRALTPELFRKYNSWTTRTFFWERWVFSLKSLEGTLTGDGANNGNRLERFSTAKVNEPMIPGIKAFGLAILFIPGGLATIVCALFAVVHAPFSLLNTGLTVGRTKLGKLTSFVEPEEFRPYTVLLTRNLPWDDLAYSLKS